MIAVLALVVVALAVGGLLAALMLRDAGYVLISYGGVTLETSFWLALATLVVLWVVVSALFYLARRSRHGSANVTNWVRGRRTASVRARSLQGTMLLAEGRWREAEEALLESAGKLAAPLDDYLGAARGANAAARFEQRDAILDRAREATPEATFVVELIRAELQQAGGEWRQSVATLEDLRRQAPRHPQVLTRLFEAHRALQDWEAVAELAPALPGEVGADTADLQTAIWRTRLANSKRSVDAADHARNTWHAMPKPLRDDEALLLDYVDAVAGDEAEAALRQGLKRQWRESWVRRYGTIAADANKRRKTALGWLEEHPDDPAVLLTLGRLSVAANDAPKGRDYLEQSLRAKSDKETLIELAKVCTRSGELAKANEYYRQALEGGGETRG